ncbi:MAG: hypothetical protein ACE5FU_10880 [Nitrospinota bacterium]
MAALALFPVTIHTYLEVTQNDGRSTAKIKKNLLGLSPLPGKRKPEKVQKQFDTIDWVERKYIAAGGKQILFFAARSFDYKRLYHHPEIALVGSQNISFREVKKIPGLKDHPVHLIYDKDGEQQGIIVFSISVEDTLVGNPYAFQLLNSWKSLFQFKRPMTLFFVYDPSFSPRGVPEESMAVRLLSEAVLDFQAQQNEGKYSVL